MIDYICNTVNHSGSCSSKIGIFICIIVFAACSLFWLLPCAFGGWYFFPQDIGQKLFNKITVVILILWALSIITGFTIGALT